MPPSGTTRLPIRNKLGICQWFHFKDAAAVEQTVETLTDLGVRHLRTGISWADYLRPGGKAWYDWQMKQLKGLEILLSVWHTPPSLAQNGRCNGPPRRLLDYADFIDQIITEYGDSFASLELWNEPNNRYKWDFVESDPGWRQFAEMIGSAAYWSRQRGQTTVLGGMIPVDPHWLRMIGDFGVLQYIDVVAIHAFPGMWWPDQPNWDWHAHWHGWPEKIRSITPAAGDRPLWVTETGLATWDLALRRPAKYVLQAEKLQEAARAPAERVYWYSLIDLDPDREAIEGFHADENEYHMGLIRHDGTKKEAFYVMQDLMRGATASGSRKAVSTQST